MKIFSATFLGILIFSTAHGASFLSAQKFPKTFDDLSFKSQMDVLAAGYEPFETIYGPDGRCISNCAYPGITIEYETARDDLRTKNAQKRDQEAQSDTTPDDQTSPEPISEQQPTKKTPVTKPTKKKTPPATGDKKIADDIYDYDTPKHSAIFPANPVRNIPLIVTSPFGRRSVENGTAVHKGIDIRAAMGTPVYATADGTVIKVATQGQQSNGNYGCGKYIEIKHNNGYKTQYCHLSEQYVSVGEYVAADSLIGKSGNSGGKNMTPHLHYMVYDLNGNPDPGPVNAINYLVPGTWRCKESIASHNDCRL